MKKLIDSRYFWLLTALLGAVLLPLLTSMSFHILLALPAEYGIRNAITQSESESFEDANMLIAIIQAPTGLILGMCAGYSLKIWREKKAMRTARRISLYGGSCVVIFFGYLWTIVRPNPIELWGVALLFGYPFVFGIVLFLWGLHLPNPKPESQTETESSP